MDSTKVEKEPQPSATPNNGYTWRSLEGLSDEELWEEIRRRSAAAEPLMTVEEFNRRLEEEFPELARCREEMSKCKSEGNDQDSV